MANENEEIKVTDERADDRIAVHIREQSTNFNSPSCCAVELWCGLNGPDVVGEGLEFGRRAGYTAAANETAASQDLNLCGASMGVHFAEYDLASYLSSWMARPTTPISSATLTRFRRQLGQYFLREQDHRFAYEMATTLAVNFPLCSQVKLASRTRLPQDQRLVPLNRRVLVSSHTRRRKTSQSGAKCMTGTYLTSTICGGAR